MNRQIKFRAWIPSSKEMINGGLMIGNFGEGEGSVVVDTRLQEGEALKGLIWMQFTGLKDKNRKEIYEGDILKDIMGNWEVMFWRGAFGMELGDRKTPLCINNMENYEIIGNIFENKKLLDV